MGELWKLLEQCSWLVIFQIQWESTFIGGVRLVDLGLVVGNGVAVEGEADSGILLQDSTWGLQRRGEKKTPNTEAMLSC